MRWVTDELLPEAAPEPEIIGCTDDQAQASAWAEIAVKQDGVPVFVFYKLQTCEMPPPPKPVWTLHANGDGPAQREVQ